MRSLLQAHFMRGSSSMVLAHTKLVFCHWATFSMMSLRRFMAAS
uniref:Uncharacterized protein n=1 Tax=Arundo donax TaxID=35708 RepID=A0A0A9AJA6_ARUDO